MAYANWAKPREKHLRLLTAASQEVEAIYNLGASLAKNDENRDAFLGRYPLLEKYFSRVENEIESLISLNDLANEIDPSKLKATELLSTFPDQSQTKLIKDTRARYMCAHEFFVKAQRKFEKPTPQLAAEQSFSNVSASWAQTSNLLPKIKLPSFGGQYENWVSWRDLFKSLVHENPSLSNISKFHHLLGSLTGIAKSSISAIPVTEADYPRAWTTLCQAFENSRVLASVYITKLFSFKPKTGPEQLQVFLTELADTVLAFRSLPLNDHADYLLFCLLSQHLQLPLRQEFENSLKKDEIPTCDQLISFVKARRLAHQLADPASFASQAKKPMDRDRVSPKGGPASTSGAKPASPKATLCSVWENQGRGNTANPKVPERTTTQCCICSEHHGLYQCSKFNGMTPLERYEALKGWEGCKNCFSYKHTLRDCKSNKSPCRICHGKHNPLVCIVKPKPTSIPSSSGPSTSVEHTTTLYSRSSHQGTSPQVLLATAMVQLKDDQGKLQTFRAVLDSGSQYNYVTQKVTQRLGLKVVKTPRRISTLGGELFESSHGVTQCTMVAPNLQFPMEAVVVKSITTSLPTSPIPSGIRKHFSKYPLADAKWAHPAGVDILLGAEAYSDIVIGSFITIKPHLPKLLPTLFGHVVMGKLQGASATPRGGTSLFSTIPCQDNLCVDLKSYWDLEDTPSHAPVGPKSKLTPDEQRVEDLFLTTTTRLEDGRFMVRLPFDRETVPDLSDSQFVAKKRFLNLEQKLARNPELRDKYCSFMEEYETLGHMTKTKAPAKYAIPHHGVFGHHNQKLRVVFDGSAQCRNGSLNDHLLPGPALQNDIRGILVNFRAHLVAFSADAVKMFRQILVHPDDRLYQTIYWRPDPSQPLSLYQLNTVTYGLTSSPYHSIRCLKVLEEEGKSSHPLAALALSRDLFVDDIVTGASTVEQAMVLRDQLIQLLARGGFQLSKWASNAPELLSIAGSTDLSESKDLTPSEPNSSAVKVLGTQWEPTNDMLTFQVQLPSPETVTKRVILSTVARFWEPLGLLGPATINFKILIQELWLGHFGWDDPVPSTILAKWKALIKSFPRLNNVKVPRCVTRPGLFKFQLVGFCDASARAMCCVIYIRILQDDKVFVHLLTARTKVAPVKGVTIPRLELTSALLLARLLASLSPFQDIVSAEQLPTYLFSDSTVALAWISQVSPARLKVFVANRVTEIQSLTNSDSWGHVRTHDNPADLGSRGVLPETLIDNTLWWHGPSWLSLPQDQWPKLQEAPMQESDIPELKTPNSMVTLISCDPIPESIDWMNRFSDYRRLLRVVARILRLVHNVRHPKERRHGELQPLEILHAFQTCVRVTQLYHLLQGNPARFPEVQIQYRSLNPVLDTHGLIRVGGRLQHSDGETNQKHPLLLPRKAKFTLLMIRYYHSVYLHPSPSLLQSLLQRRVWIPQARRLVRTWTRNCVQCYTARAPPYTPQMGDLPSVRVTASRAFSRVGIDFAGPYQHKNSRLRTAKVSKMYLCVFVCMCTKAVHLEAVTDLSTPGFLAAFARFIARRGLPSQVFSDNGTNFVGASREISEVLKWFRDQETQDDLTRHGNDHGIFWVFSPPYSPHFGGLWEAAVRSTKRHLRAALGDTPVTYEEFATLLARVEAILNSRPLCPMTESLEDIDVLTPGHFLIGAPLLELPSPTLLDIPLNRLDRWQLVKRAAEVVWKRFHREYLHTLQTRVKWHKPSPNLAVGDLVLIRSSNTSPLSWPRARVTEIFPGSDGIVRVVTLKTPNGVYKRAATNLVPLPVTDSSRDREDLIPAD